MKYSLFLFVLPIGFLLHHFDCKAQAVIPSPNTTTQNSPSRTAAAAPSPAPADQTSAAPASPSSFTFSGFMRVIEVDPTLNLPKDQIPFDRPFVLAFTLTAKGAVREVQYKRIQQRNARKYLSGGNTFGSEDNLKFVQKETKLYVYVPPLRPNSYYDFLISQNQADDYIDEYYALFQKLHQYETAQNPADKPTLLEEARTQLRTLNRLKEAKNDPSQHKFYGGDICRFYRLQNIDCSDCNTIPPVNPNEYILQLYHYYKQHLEIVFKKNDPKEKDLVVTAIKSRLKVRLTLQDYISASSCSDIYEEEIFFIDSWFDAQSHIFNFETRTRYSLNADFGAISYYQSEKFWGISPYVGLNVELRYFDKDIPYRLIPKTAGIFDLSHWSIALGLAQGSVAKSGVRSDFFKKTSFLTGVGYRLTSALRLTGGFLWYNKLDPNPLLDSKTLAVVPHFGLSIDLQVRKFIQNLGFGPKLENPDYFLPTNRR